VGYHTHFEGLFRLDRPLAPEHKAYLEAFCHTRRMRRNAKKASQLPDPVRESARLPIGPQGGYFVGGGGWKGQDEDNSILDYNRPPWGQPGLWCQWIPTEDGNAIHWDGGEKFYDYVEWIGYLIEHFLLPWGYRLSGEVLWEGEEFEDRGVIAIENNEVRTKMLPPPPESEGTEPAEDEEGQ
jgi:hypothetical protein